MGLKQMVDSYVGNRWSRSYVTRNWFTSPILVAYFDRCISEHAPTGVAGAILAETGDRPLGRGLSIGAGTGYKERQLLKANAVETFDTFEIAEGIVEASRAQSKADGLADRMNEQFGDAFEQDVAGKYDLVYWDHSLHHMYDVRKAVRWSLDAVRPGGVLAINEYVGPTRLQFTRQEYDFAKEFVDQHRDALGVGPEALTYSNPLRRLRQFIKDPSEAPQSNLIEAAWEETTGTRMHVIGGVALHIGAPLVLAAEPEGGPLTEALKDWDAVGRDRGLYHFAIGIYTKPA